MTNLKVVPPPADVESDVDRVMALAGRLWRRTLDVVGNIKRELADKL